MALLPNQKRKICWNGMMTVRWPYRTPRGTKDLNPDEAARKVEVEAVIRCLFRRWGYREVVTSTLEYASLEEKGAGQEKVFRFFDREGNLLALRSDLTTPIAHMVATRLRDWPRPLRLFYVANVFRYEETGVGRDREFYQAGIELIGSSGPEADAEVVALAVKTLQEVGLTRFRVDIGHVGFFHGVLEECGLNEEQKALVREAALHKDLVALTNFLQASSLPQERRELIKSLFWLRGGEEVFHQAEKMASDYSRPFLNHLRQVWNLLDDFGLTPFLEVDLGMVKDFTYYTGLLLEGYSPDLGFTLCTGGRYDQLIAQLGGEPSPAVGFAVGIERLLQTIPTFPEEWPRGVLLVDEAGDPRFRWEVAERLRQAGVIVADSFAHHDGSVHPLARRFAWVVTIRGWGGQRQIVCRSSRTGEETLLSLEGLVSFLREKEKEGGGDDV